MIKILVLPLLLIFFISCQKDDQQYPYMDIKLYQTIRLNEISGRLHWLFRSLDKGELDQVEDIFAHEVELDMQSLTGDVPRKMSAKEAAAYLAKLGQGMDASHHVIGNYGIVVNEDRATVTAYGTQTYMKKNKSGKKIKNNYGIYEIELLLPNYTDNHYDIWNWRWKITKYRYLHRFSDS
jgi:hypothetical protein